MYVNLAKNYKSETQIIELCNTEEMSLTRINFDQTEGYLTTTVSKTH